MIPPEYMELMNLELDGTITPAEARCLADYLAQHADAHSYYLEMRRALGLFGGVPLLEPPTGLRPRILAAVARKPTGRGRWRSLRVSPALAGAFGVGLVVGMILLGTIYRIPPAWLTVPSTEIPGSIVAEVAAGHGVAGEPLQISLAGISGTVRTYADGDEILIRLGLECDRRVDVRFEYDERLACAAYRTESPTSCDITFSGKQIELTHDGHGAYDFVLQHTELITPSIRMQILEDRRVLFERSFVPARD
jgi:hypothetical protein